MSNTEQTPPITTQPPTPAPTPIVAPSDELIDIEQFAKIKFKVAKIESVEAIPKSKKLYKLQVDLGTELGKRQILSGIAQHYTPDQLVGKQIIIVANLKPAQMMGELSQGMLLAAGDGTMISILHPDKEVPLGSNVR